MMELAGWVVTVLAVAGVLLNNRRLIACFPLWMASNAVSAVLHGQAGMVSLAVRDAIFFALAIEGWIRWRRKAERR